MDATTEPICEPVCAPAAPVQLSMTDDAAIAHARGRSCAHACNTTHDCCESTPWSWCWVHKCTPYTSAQVCSGVCCTGAAGTSLVSLCVLCCADCTRAGQVTPCLCMCGSMPCWQAGAIAGASMAICGLAGIITCYAFKPCGKMLRHSTQCPNFAAGYRSYVSI